MITILVDECYAFDYLSILEIKKNISEACSKNWSSCYDDIRNQLSDNFYNILNSVEYKDLLAANKLTFEMIDLIRSGNKSITAKEIDDCNLIRYEKKIKLQNKFFPKNKITEIKK